MKIGNFTKTQCDTSGFCHFLTFSHIWLLRQYYLTDLDSNFSIYAYIRCRTTLKIPALNISHRKDVMTKKRNSWIIVQWSSAKCLWNFCFNWKKELLIILFFFCFYIEVSRLKGGGPGWLFWEKSSLVYDRPMNNNGCINHWGYFLNS